MPPTTPLFMSWEANWKGDRRGGGPLSDQPSGAGLGAPRTPGIDDFKTES